MQSKFIDRYSETDFCVIRTPLLSFSTVGDLFSGKIRLLDCLKDPIILEAIYVASPSLYIAFERAKKSKDFQSEWEKIEISFLKYILRMSYRCTPFGLMAGLTVSGYGDTNKISFQPPSSYIKHCRLDMDVTGRLVQRLNRQRPEMLHYKFFPNNTIYKIGQAFRYYEDVYSDGKRNYLLTSLDVSPELEKVLSASLNGKTGHDLVETVHSMGYDPEESTSFILDLISSRFIVSEFLEKTTGDEYATDLIKTLTAHEELVDLSTSLSRIIRRLDEMTTVGAQISDYQHIEENLKQSKIEFESGQVVQVELIKPPLECSVSRKVIEEVKSIINFLVNTSPPVRQAPALSEFKTAFLDRYENQEIPLLEVLDSEFGIGFPVGNRTNRTDHFAEGISIDVESTAGTLNRWEISAWDRFMMEKYREAISNGRSEIIINDEDPFVKYYTSINRQDPPYDMPPAMYTVFNLLPSGDDDFTIVYGLSSAPSSANILGRFCHVYPELEAKIKTAIEKEAAARPDAIIAEIVHVPESRLGNILSRPAFHKYEIPIASAPSVEDEKTILLEDLLVSVKEGKIVIRSKRLNRRIIPRQSTVHNFTMNTIPAYQFLCTLQAQEVPFNFNFRWGILGEYSYLPRVVYGKTILARQQWALSEKHLQLNVTDKNGSIQRIKEYLQLSSIPLNIILVEGDNELPLDLSHQWSLEIIFQKLKPGLPILLMEDIFAKSESLFGGFTNEIVMPFITRDIIKKDIRFNSNIESQSVIRTFHPTSHEWVYFKLYCGEKQADKLLATDLFEMNERLREEGLLETNFWLRYADPKSHLRLRYRLDATSGSRQRKVLNEGIERLAQSGNIHNIVIDTYVRELERYGHYNIENSENLFCIQSEFVISYLHYVMTNNMDEDIYRWMTTLRALDDMFTTFGLGIEEKQSLLDVCIDGYILEFGFKKDSFIKELSSKYRQHKKQIEGIMENNSSSIFDEHVLDLLERKKMKEMDICRKILLLYSDNNLEVSKFSLISSYAHMLCNRMFNSNQRYKELLVFDLLRQYYRSKVARTKGKEKSVEV